MSKRLSSHGTFPTLYKLTSTGATQSWQINVVGTKLVTTFGQVGGKLQTTSDTVKSGKNAGRKNATAPEEQALKEAESQWIKKKKAGYVETISAAQDRKTDSVIEGGFLPMLAKVYEDHVDKITYPVAVQPKLDGHRCIAVFDEDYKVSLWTRTRKRITSVPHIEKRLEQMAKKMCLHVTARVKGQPRYILDGELYNHDLKNDFEKLTSAARKEGGNEHSKKLQYHVYDIMTPECFKKRFSYLANILLLGGEEVQLVDTQFIEEQERVAYFLDLYKSQGYEGAMVRLLGIPYEGKRSKQLLKVKSFEDAEFEIIGVEEGRGKLQGHAGSFICRNPAAGKKFNVKMSGDTSKLREYWESPEKYIGRMLTVQFQGRTADGIPRFPVGLRFWEPL